MSTVPGISLGHPIGATGVRIARYHAAPNLKRRGGRFGLEDHVHRWWTGARG
ncbi:hypothetical protein ACU4GD_34060 [Cupriavidus basilensis]